MKDDLARFTKAIGSMVRDVSIETLFDGSEPTGSLAYALVLVNDDEPSTLIDGRPLSPEVFAR
jgi:hypothetical protein